MNDPISDMLTRIRNANRALLPWVDMPHSKIKESIAGILSQYLGKPLANEPRTLALTGRRLLREKFNKADMGITGANFAVAETGTIVLITNEGNGRLTTT